MEKMLVDVPEKSQNFRRGDKNSASVRLRSKKAENQGQKKKNRHSGDFGFFKHGSTSNSGGGGGGVAAETNKKEGDWSYITFQNGVPTVQDIRTNVGPVSGREFAATPPKATPSSSHGNASKRVSGDFSLFSSSPSMPQFPATPPMATPIVSTPAALALKNQGRGGAKPRQQEPVRPRPQVAYRRKSDHANGGVVINGGGAMAGGLAKRCSGEFSYYNNQKPGSDIAAYGGVDSPLRERRGPAEATPQSQVVRVQVNYSRPSTRPKSMAVSTSPDVVKETTPSKQTAVQPPQAMPRPPGLGRRAVTQVNIHQNRKKNSYNSALCKSQENLVKSKLNDEDDGEGFFEDKKSTAVRKGLLWQQRDKLFSQWKERYFILTPDYLQCFKKGSSRITEMGEFIFKIKLCDVEEVDLLDKRGYLVISITMSGRGEGKIYVRKTEGIRDWYNSLKECVRDSKKRRTDRVNSSFWSAKQLTDSSSIEKWLLARNKNDAKKNEPTGGEAAQELSKSSRSEITLDELDNLYRSEEAEKEAEMAAKRLAQNNHTTNIKVNSATPPPMLRMRSREELRSNKSKKINRLSLMSDIGLPDFGGQDLGIDLDKGIFLRKGLKAAKGDADSNDSGNNSMNTNGSVGSSNSSHSNPRDASHRDERLETHLEADRSEDENDEFIDDDLKGGLANVGGINNNKRRSQHMGLQITHV